MENLNILLITADHLRSDAIACNKESAGPNALAHIIRTPHLDELAEDGVTFTNCYSPDPICVPARASITTGCYPHRCTGKKDNAGGILPGHPKLAEVFADAGYCTYAIGKLHYLPYAAPGQPRTLHGFQYAELNEEGRLLAAFDPDGITKGLEDYHDWLGEQGWGGYERAHNVGNNDAKPSSSPVPADLHEESWVAERAMAAIDRHRQENAGTPFLLWASFAKPHPPYDPPAPYDRMYDPRSIPEPIGGWDGEFGPDRDVELGRRRIEFGWDEFSPETVQASRARYAGLVSYQDEMIGRILAHLDVKGCANDTIVIFTADHGDLLGDFGRFFKTCLYEGSVKVPMIWRVPGKTAANQPRAQLVGLQDILPTLCALTGIPLPAIVDGEDLSGILADPAVRGRDFIVSETSAGGQKAMLRDPRWKYIWTEQGGLEELYDMNADPQELVNLAARPEHAPTMASLRSSLITWSVANGDTQIVRDGSLVSKAVSTDAPSFHRGALGYRRY